MWIAILDLLQKEAETIVFNAKPTSLVCETLFSDRKQQLLQTTNLSLTSLETSSNIFPKTSLKPKSKESIVS